MDLAKIKEATKVVDEFHLEGGAGITKEELYWLIEQAKKVEGLKQENKKLTAFYNYFSELYGQGLEIANWHQNGELELFDGFFENAEQEMN